jgi:riboflavin synthase
MFTGIVEERGEVVDIAVESSDAAGSARLTVRAPMVTSDAGHGDSIAVSGVCLTVVDRGSDTFTVDVMGETLRSTTISALRVGDPVNLERAVTSSTRLGGHLVQGHVDGTGVIADRRPHERYDEVRIGVGADLAPYLAPKGSVAVDGISLTIVDVVDGADGGAVFGVGIIPETRSATTIGSTPNGARVNVEVDVIAKYVERLLTGPWAAGARAAAVGGRERA